MELWTKKTIAWKPNLRGIAIGTIFTLFMSCATVGMTAQFVLIQEITGDCSAWARDDNAITVTPNVTDSTQNEDITQNTNSNSAQDERIARVDHTGSRDWAIRAPRRIDVRPGEIFRLTCEVKVAGNGVVDTGVTLRGGNDGEQVIDWIYGGRSQRECGNWVTLRSEFIVPRDATSIEPRLTGTGPATIEFRRYRIERSDETIVLDADKRVLSVENTSLKLDFNVRDASFTVLDRRTGRTWRPVPITVENFGITAKIPDESPTKNAAGKTIRFEMIHAGTGLRLGGTITLESEKPELLVTLAPIVEQGGPADVPITTAINYPYPFATERGDRVVLPMNEGISFPVEEDAPSAEWLHTYGGHGLCMAFFGVVRDSLNPAESSGVLGILETPDDSAVMTKRYKEKTQTTSVAGTNTVTENTSDTAESLLSCAPQWVAQCGNFGYERKIRYVFLDHGGYVGLCKRYREYAKSIGLWVPFTEKVRRNPTLQDGIDRLIGAANIWCWDGNRVEIVHELQSAGIDRILWSGGGTAEELAAMNKIPGVLTSRYDIYQDVMDPAQFEKLPGVHGDWVTSAWPNDIILNADGSWRHGWEVDQKDQTQPRIPCGVICDSRAIPYAEKRIAAELATKPYLARFLDTTTAAPWQDCFHPDHPMTRSDSKRWKMELLRMMGERFHLVCGSETGHEASVPFCDFYEGMMSLGPYRVPDSGRDMMRKWDDVPEQVEKYQLGETYRLPLWELVYHDCTVSYWYWGDYNNKLPSLWAKRDLFNALYGVPPMYMFTRQEWNESQTRKRFAASFQVAATVARRTGMVEMLDHRILSPDRTVQQSSFADGTVVTVNFGDEAFELENGKRIPAGGTFIKENEGVGNRE